MATAVPGIMATSTGRSNSAVNRPVANAPSPAIDAWPRVRWPENPVMAVIDTKITTKPMNRWAWRRSAPSRISGTSTAAVSAIDASTTVAGPVRRARPNTPVTSPPLPADAPLLPTSSSRRKATSAPNSTRLERFSTIWS